MKYNHINTTKFRAIRSSFNFFILTTKKLIGFLRDTKLIGSVTSSRIDQLLVAYEKLFVRFTRLYEDKGPKWTVNHFKLLYNVATRFTLGLPFNPIPWTKSSKDGFPSILSGFRSYLSSNNKWEKRFALTGIRLYPLIVLPISRDVDNITRPQENTEERKKVINDFITFIKKFFTDKAVYRHEVGFDASYSLGSGPNGPALLTAHLDVYALKREGLYDVITSFFKLTKHPLSKSFEYISKTDPEGCDTENLKSAKLSFLPENGGKTRVIAVVDFWTQQLLRPIHLAVMVILKGIKSDGTFSQNAAFKRILQVKSSFCASFDLSAATDRFPFKPQYAVVSQLFGIQIANHWARLLIDRSYEYLDDNKEKKKVKWSVGQPLGAYSSWAVFSLTHHLLVQYAYYLTLKDTSSYKLWSYTNYSLLGDDIVIMDSEVAKEYQGLMEKMGVVIHPLKSLVADKHCGEFTKRLFFLGEEISPIPITIFSGIKESLYNLPQFLEMITERWGIPSALVELWATRDNMFTKKVGLLTTIIGFRNLINGGSSFPFCLTDRVQVLKELRTYIYENVVLKVEYWGNEMVLNTTGWSKSKRGKLTIKCEEDLFDALKASRIAVPTSLLVEPGEEWGGNYFSPKLHPLMHAYMFTFKKMEQRVDYQSQFKYSEDISQHYRDLTRVDLASLDLFFLKTKRRRMIKVTQLAVKFIVGLFPEQFKL